MILKDWLEEEDTQEHLRSLARWLIIVPLILILLFGCGSLALLETRPAFADTRSQLRLLGDRCGADQATVVIEGITHTAELAFRDIGIRRCGS